MRITAGKFKNKQIKTIESEFIRPTLSKVRESLFNVLFDKTDGASFLDLFAGSGIVGIEAASRGAQKVVFIEKNPKHYRLLQSNLKSIDFDYKTFLADSITMLEKFDENSFDIIYSDPPYHTNLNNSVLKILGTKNILKNDGVLVMEVSKDENFEDEIANNGFEIIKEKIYGDTKILYIKGIM